MPSSTSNSETVPRAETWPKALWPASWLLAIAIVSLCVGSWEVFWRNYDFVPSVTDDAGLWAHARHRGKSCEFELNRQDPWR